jgi:uncharacterized coiled-coil protein SlyX
MNESLNKKLVEIESALGLLQHDFEKQNEAILWLTRRIAGLEKSIERLGFQIANLESTRSPATLKDEKPPHY